MQVTIESIAFNHDPSGKTTGAFNIRRNESETIPMPEWSAGRTNSDSSVAAYAISEAPNPVTIKASFRCSEPSVQKTWIRATDGTVSQFPSDLRPHNVLGVVRERLVAFR